MDVTPTAGRSRTVSRFLRAMVTVEAALGPGWGSKQVPGDDLPLDLGRPLEDPGCAHFPVEVFEQVPTFEGDRAVHLDRDVDHLLRGLGGKQLRHRGAPRDMLVLAVIRFGGRVNQRPGRLEAG